MVSVASSSPLSSMMRAVPLGVTQVMRVPSAKYCAGLFVFCKQLKIGGTQYLQAH